jgi:hypothetical protein
VEVVSLLIILSVRVLGIYGFLLGGAVTAVDHGSGASSWQAAGEKRRFQ